MNTPTTHITNNDMTSPYEKTSFTKGEADAFDDPVPMAPPVRVPTADNPVTFEEMVDAAKFYVAHLDRRAVEGDGSCVYRTRYGRKCLIGAFLPEDVRPPSEYGFADLANLAYGGGTVGDLFGVHPTLCELFQSFHDGMDSRLSLLQLVRRVSASIANTEKDGKGLATKLRTLRHLIRGALAGLPHFVVGGQVPTHIQDYVEDGASLAKHLSAYPAIR